MFQRIGRFFQRNMLIVISSEQSEWRDLIPVISTNVERSLHALRLVEMTGKSGARDDRTEKARSGGAGYWFLFEDLLGEHGEIDAPVAPDMSSIGLYILVFVTLAVPVVTQVNGALVEEVGLTHSHPVELWLASKQTS